MVDGSSNIFKDIKGKAIWERVKELGGVERIIHGVQTSEAAGISSEPTQVKARGHHFGVNEIKMPETQSFWDFFKEPFEDLILRILLVAAVLDLAVDMWSDPSTGWIDGTAIFMTVLLVATVTAVNNYDKQKKFIELYLASETSDVTVVRDSQLVKNSR